jgi:MscS family membrane protein
MEDLGRLYAEAMQRISPGQLGLAFLFVLSGLVLRKVTLHLLFRYVKSAARRSATDVDDLLVDAVGKPLGAAIFLVALYFAVQSFTLSNRAALWSETAFSVLISVGVAWLMLRLVNVLTHLLSGWAQKTDTALDDQLVPLVNRAAKIVVGLLGALMILQNMGYSISGLIAGLGVGGLAVALAAQKTLADLFGSVMLLTDRPFLTGDWIKSPDAGIEGVVERIGFRSTSIRTFEKTLISVPNSRLADFIIDNIAQRPMRRVWITVGVTYGTSAEQMREAVRAIEVLLKGHEEVSQEFFLVYFTDFNSSSLDIMVYYFTETVVWADYLRIREEVNLKIMEALEGLNLSIAFPTRTVHLANANPADPLPPVE